MAESGRIGAESKKASRPPERTSGPDGPSVEVGADVERGAGGVLAARGGLLGAPPPVARFTRSHQVALIQRMQQRRGNAFVGHYLAQLRASSPTPVLAIDAAAAVPRSDRPVVTIQRATIIDVNGVEHSEDENNFTEDANENLHDAAGNVIIFRAPDGVFVEQGSPSGTGDQPLATPDQSTDQSTGPSSSSTDDLTSSPGDTDVPNQSVGSDVPSPSGSMSSPNTSSPDAPTSFPGDIDQPATDQPNPSPVAPGPDLDIASMSTADKMGEAIRRANLGAELQNRISELLTPESLATMAGMTAVFVAAQLTPAGWVADLIGGGLVLVSAILMGPEIVAVIQHSMAFATEATNATTPGELDQAGQEFAVAVTKVGVDVVMAILLHKAVKASVAEINGPPLDTFGAMVTPDGQVVRVPIDQIPDNASATTGSGEGPSSSGTEPPGNDSSGGEPVRKGPIPDELPANLNEQIVLDEAKSGQGKIAMRNLADTPRLVDNYGPGEWVKMRHSHEFPDGSQTRVHWFRNLTTGDNVEFKFKVGQVLNPLDQPRRSF